MKKSIILLTIVLIVSCATTGLNFFDTIDNLTVSEYTSLTHRQQLLICEGFLIASCQFNGNQFIARNVSAVDLQKQVISLIKEYKPDDRMIVNIFNIAMYQLVNRTKNG